MLCGKPVYFVNKILIIKKIPATLLAYRVLRMKKRPLARSFFVALINCCYIPMSPMLGAADSFFSSGISVMRHSVVRIMAATEAAF